uniref:CUB domain-containing protein n=1 Tax=Elaeophora elaphi TaxID=1147741 RepID=A0A0R3RQG7_9BILA
MEILVFLHSYLSLAAMRVEILKIELYRIPRMIQACGHYLVNIGCTCTLSSGKLANYRIPFLIPCLYLLLLIRLANGSMTSCRCVHFNSTGIFQSPDFPKAPLSFLSSPTLPPSSLLLQHPFLCLLYKFIAPDGYIIEVTFDYFHLSPRTNRLFDSTLNGLVDERTAHSGEFCAREIEVGQTFYSHTRYLIFHVQFSGTSKGFHGTYNFISKERFLSDAIEIQPCRFRVDTLAGNLFSPNYPYFYPNTANCTYDLAPRPELNLVISLEYLNLRRHACHEDFIDIYQMHPKIHLEKLCYDSMPPYQIQTRRGCIIEFHGGNNDEVKVSQQCLSSIYVPREF